MDTPTAHRPRLLLALLLPLAQMAPAGAAEALMLHPENPRYFLFRGKPTVIIGSGEHYGAVLNLDFDFIRYLDTVAADGLNHTRLFTGGAYLEPQGAFGIARNTLAPAPGRSIAPWARSDRPGYAGGGNRFDLSRWSPEYFERLHRFLSEAGKRGIIVEVNLFCPMYGEEQWALSPFREPNNINGLGNIGRNDLYTLDRHGGLLEVEERMSRKFVDELRDHDNIYFEIMNEPYVTGVPVDWQRHMTDVVAAAQKDHPSPKLISWNIANNAAKVERPHPAVAIFNFHYATPPDTVAMNRGLGKPIGDNETGFRGTSDGVYREEAWDFILAGGSLFSHLDYSFAVGFEDGTFAYPPTQPGGGSAALRKQLRTLREFIDGLEFLRMSPDASPIVSNPPEGYSARSLSLPGKAHAVYFRPGTISRYSARWTGTIEVPRTGEYTFHTFSNDGSRLWISGEKVIDDWTDHGEKEVTGKIRLEAGKRHDLKLEYFYNGGQAAMKLWWSADGVERGPVPSSALRLPTGDRNGLRGEYFEGTDLSRPWHARDDEQVNFAWGTSSPFARSPGAGPLEIDVSLQAGRWRVEWLDPATGKVVKEEALDHGGGIRRLEAPAFAEDMALRLVCR